MQQSEEKLLPSASCFVIKDDIDHGRHWPGRPAVYLFHLDNVQTKQVTDRQADRQGNFTDVLSN